MSFADLARQGHLQEAACEYRAAANAVLHDAQRFDSSKGEELDQLNSQIVSAYRERFPTADVFTPYGGGNWNYWKADRFPSFQEAFMDRDLYTSHEAVWNAINDVVDARTKINISGFYDGLSLAGVALLLGFFLLPGNRWRWQAPLTRFVCKIAGSNPDANVRAIRVVLFGIMPPAAVAGLLNYWRTHGDTNVYPSVSIQGCAIKSS